MTNATFIFSFDFTTREQYVVQRAAWKATYKALSIAQRQAKLAMKKAFREDDYSTANRMMSAVASNKELARTALSILAEAKEEAHAQYMAAHGEKLATA